MKTMNEYEDQFRQNQVRLNSLYRIMGFIAVDNSNLTKTLEKLKDRTLQELLDPLCEEDNELEYLLANSLNYTELCLILLEYFCRGDILSGLTISSWQK